MPHALLADLDDLVARGVYASRAAAVRAGVEVITELQRRRATDRAIIDGCRRVPPDRLGDETQLSRPRGTR